ncbi:MAG: ABC transporter permease subunit [Candidatus Latescibacterota bacterium]
MWRDIARRELLDHLTSLRSLLVLVLAVILMGLNGVLTTGGQHQGRMQAYLQSRQQTADLLEERAADLAELGIRGLERLDKQPSPLAFCAGGRDEYLPPGVEARIGATYGFSNAYLYEPWHLRYGVATAPPRAGVVAEAADLDWGFIVGLVLSLMAVLLTYDGICGDRQAGTLPLVLGGAVPRAAVIGGKFAAALAVLLAALALGVGVSLAATAALGSLNISLGLLAKAAAMLVAGGLYLAFFVACGLLVSTRCQRPATSLVTLVLLWTVLVFLVPNTTAGVVSAVDPAGGPTQADWDAATEDNWVRHGIRQLDLGALAGRAPRALVEKVADFTADWLALDRRFAEERHRASLEPVVRGMAVNRLLPHGALQAALESLAGTGLSRHLRFLEEARRFERTFRQFVQTQDAADPDSYHLVGVTAGMSHRAVVPEAIPQFEEDLSARASVAATAPDLLVLCLFAVAGFLAAHLAFLRAEVT